MLKTSDLIQNKLRKMDHFSKIIQRNNLLSLISQKVIFYNNQVIICIGSVGSGKSTFTVNHLKDYVRVNRDTLKTKEKCLKVAEDAMK